MIIPGVKYIGWCAINSVPADAELKAAAGIAVDISNVSFSALFVVGDATLELADSNENNGSNQKATLSFVTLSEFSQKRCAFIVQTVSGLKYLIGTRDSVPAVSIKDTYAGPTAAHGKAVSVELSAACAWIKLEGVEVTINADDFITFENWRQEAEELFAHKQHRHPASDIDDEEYNDGMTQDEINQDLADLAAAGIVL